MQIFHKSINLPKKAGLIALAVLLPARVRAQAGDPFGLGLAERIGLSPGPAGEPQELIVNIISYLLTFVSLLAVIMILWGGLKWMLSMGNEDRLADAKRTLVSGIIGLIIVISAYAIVALVFNVAGQFLE